MNLGQSIIEALQSLSANKLRAGLTILGIVIGVGAVIAMLGVGAGAQATITGSISGIGTNLLFVFQGNMQEEVRNPKPLTIQDAQSLKDEFLTPSVAAVAPTIQSNGEITYSRLKTTGRITGVTPEYETVRNYTLIEGEFIKEEHLLGQASVALLGPQIADKLFGRREGLIGETVRIEGQPFRVIGILASKGGGSFGSEDDRILLPMTTAQERIIHRARDRVDLILVQAVSAELVNRASDEVGQVLRTRHRVMIGADDFTIFSQEC
jgi:putative ABC transport system permease protein